MSRRHGDLVNVIQCRDTRKVMAGALDAGWSWIGYTKSGHVEIQWPATGQLLHCATTPSDPNSWKRFAVQIFKASGVDLRPKGNRRRSRKPSQGSDFSLAQVRRDRSRGTSPSGWTSETPSQPREIASLERRRMQHQADAARAVEAERRRRDIEDLMRPGYGR